MSSLVAMGNHAVHSFLWVSVYVCVCKSEFLSSACHFLGLNREGSGVTGCKEQRLHGGLFTHTPESRTHMCACVFSKLAGVPSALHCFCWVFVSR